MTTRSRYDDSENTSINNSRSVHVVVIFHPAPFFLFVVAPTEYFPCKKREIQAEEIGMIEVGYPFGSVRTMAEKGTVKLELANRLRFADYTRINNDRFSLIMLKS